MKIAKTKTHIQYGEMQINSQYFDKIVKDEVKRLKEMMDENPIG